MKQLVILAGGMGTRLKDRLNGKPKAMIPVCGKPVLEHQIELAQRYGFADIQILAGHGAGDIMWHFGLGTKWGTPITYQVDRELLGTAHSLFHALVDLEPTFFVLYGDQMLDVDLDKLGAFHADNRADVTVFVHPTDHPQDSDLVELNYGTDQILRFHRKPNRMPGEFGCAGLYVMRKRTLQEWKDLCLQDIVRDLFPLMVADNNYLLAYKSDEYIKDIGTPERYDQVCAEWEHRHDYQSHSA